MNIYGVRSASYPDTSRHTFQHAFSMLLYISSMYVVEKWPTYFAMRRSLVCFLFVAQRGPPTSSLSFSFLSGKACLLGRRFATWMGAIVSFPCGLKVGTKEAGHGAIDISHIENKPSFFLALNALIKRQDLSLLPYTYNILYACGEGVDSECLVHHLIHHHGEEDGERWPENTAGLYDTRLFIFYFLVKPFSLMILAQVAVCFPPCSSSFSSFCPRL